MVGWGRGWIEVKQLAISWARGSTLPVTWHAPNETSFISDGKKKKKKMCKEYTVKVKNILLIKSSPWKNETWDQAKQSRARQNRQHTRKNSGHRFVRSIEIDFHWRQNWPLLLFVEVKVRVFKAVHLWIGSPLGRTWTCQKVEGEACCSLHLAFDASIPAFV